MFQFELNLINSLIAYKSQSSNPSFKSIQVKIIWLIGTRNLVNQEISNKGFWNKECNNIYDEFSDFQNFIFCASGNR